MTTEYRFTSMCPPGITGQEPGMKCSGIGSRIHSILSGYRIPVPITRLHPTNSSQILTLWVSGLIII